MAEPNKHPVTGRAEVGPATYKPCAICGNDDNPFEPACPNEGNLREQDDWTNQQQQTADSLAVFRHKLYPLYAEHGIRLDMAMLIHTNYINKATLERIEDRLNGDEEEP